MKVDDLTLPTRPVTVRACSQHGLAIEGTLLLRGAPGQHVGKESLLERLNDEEPFLPLLTEPGPCCVLLAKAHLLFLAVAGWPDEEPPAEWLARARTERVELTLVEGPPMQGTLMIPLIPRGSRIQDYLVSVGAGFFPLQGEQELYLINAAALVAVTPLSGRGHP
ncbi:MAG: hypothetical protein HYY85_12870 [Deltaproteobacteria bacterium]|nr:hypothetical protein [Deltaproteobacteria bacterium]